MANKKKNKGYEKSAYPNTYYTKFKKIHLVSNGFITLCEAITIDGVEEYFQWDRKNNRDLIRANTLSDAEIVIDKGVTKGWDYD